MEPQALALLTRWPKLIKGLIPLVNIIDSCRSKWLVFPFTVGVNAAS